MTPCPREKVEAGLRILARIIAKEAVKERLGKVGGRDLSPTSKDPLGEEIAGGGMDEKITMEEVA